MKEAAVFLRMSTGSIYRKVESNELPAVRVGGFGKILFRQQDLEACLLPSAEPIAKEAIR